MLTTVLVAPVEHLPALKERPDLGSVTPFTDQQALLALDAITRQQPAIVALEQSFATSTRGTALVNRVRADPALASCEIRIVTPGESVAVPSASDPAPPAPLPPPPSQPEGDAETVTPVARPVLDRHGTRRAERTPIAHGVEVFLDGSPATLVDLSTGGAQVVALGALKPNQRLRFVLPDPAGTVRVNAVVAWASFELPTEGPRYRGGLEFLDATPAQADQIGRFCDTHRR